MQYIKLLRSLSIIIIVSCIFAYIFFDGKTYGSFLRAAVVFGAIQIAIHYGYVICTEFFIGLKFKKLEIEKLKQLSKITYQSVCPCPFKHQQLIPLILDKDNSYSCDRCNKDVGVNIAIDSVLKTEIPDPKKIFEKLKQSTDSLTDADPESLT